MSNLDVETYWSTELEETVEIVECGGYGVYIGGQTCYTDETLDGIERWLGIYSMMREHA